MTESEKQVLQTRFKKSYSGKYGAVYYSEPEQVLICVLKYNYVPIAEFRKLFERMTSLAKKKRFSKFIFDKRALTSFDQPSMEWYFTVWKVEMYKYGVTMHRKILPPQNWFAQAVIAGRADILKKHPESVAFKLDIQYCTDIVDALAKPAKPAPTVAEYLQLNTL